MLVTAGPLVPGALVEWVHLKKVIVKEIVIFTMNGFATLINFNHISFAECNYCKKHIY